MKFFERIFCSNVKMNNDMKPYFSANFRDKEPSSCDMRNALILIAQEIQRFREYVADKQGIYKCNMDIDIPEQNKTYKTKLRTKNRELKKLKENLKTICNVAKIILSAKNRETELLTSHLIDMRNESSNIRKSNEQNLTLIHELRIENHNINKDVQLLCHFIHLAYEKLKRMRNETPKYLSHMDELKVILLACGQYCADYSNAQDRCAQLEQNNRFLKNKLNIVENNLAATTTELLNLRSQNTKLRIKREIKLKNEETTVKNPTSPNVTETLSKLRDGGGGSHNMIIPKTDQFKRKQDIYNRSIYISSHLKNVKNLLSDQDNMLKELKNLYRELFTPES